MNFKRNNKSPEVLWRKNNSSSINKAGIPIDLITCEKKWNYILLHGDDELGSGWNSDNLSLEESLKLYKLLKSFYINDSGLDLIQKLERRIRET